MANIFRGFVRLLCYGKPRVLRSLEHISAGNCTARGLLSYHPFLQLHCAFYGQRSDCKWPRSVNRRTKQSYVWCEQGLTAFAYCTYLKINKLQLTLNNFSFPHEINWVSMNPYTRNIYQLCMINLSSLFDDRIRVQLDYKSSRNTYFVHTFQRLHRICVVSVGCGWKKGGGGTIKRLSGPINL